MNTSLMFFSIASDVEHPYRLMIDAAKYADKHEFSGVWVPERHFSNFGGFFPNPSVISAALATITESIQLRAGSIVSPLHDVLRIAEDWSAVDNLSKGRVALSFGAGWNPDDFCFFPERYEKRQTILFEQLQQMSILWSGGSIVRQNGVNEEREIKIWPKPIQKQLPIWISITANPLTFERAGKVGANVLTHLVNQDFEQVELNIKRYKNARASAGHDPEKGIITLMLHTYIDLKNQEKVIKRIETPLKQYLAEIIDFGGVRANIGQAGNKQILAAYKQELIEIAYKKFINGRSLIGNIDYCKKIIDKVASIGVNEVAALIDFGLNYDEVMQSLSYLNLLI